MSMHAVPVSIQAGARGLFCAAPILGPAGFNSDCSAKMLVPKSTYGAATTYSCSAVCSFSHQVNAMARSRCLVAVWLLLTAAILHSQARPSTPATAPDHAGPFGGAARFPLAPATRRLIRGLQEREVLQEAELSGKLISEQPRRLLEIRCITPVQTSSSCRELLFWTIHSEPWEPSPSGRS